MAPWWWRKPMRQDPARVPHAEASLRWWVHPCATESLVTLCELVAEPSRLALLTALAEHPSQPMVDLASRVGLDRSGVIRHAMNLKPAGLVHVDRVHREHRYSLGPRAERTMRADGLMLRLGAADGSEIVLASPGLRDGLCWAVRGLTVAFGCSTRARIIAALASRGPLRTRALAVMLGCSDSLVSHHLRAMLDGAMVSLEREDGFGSYSLAPRSLVAHEREALEIGLPCGGESAVVVHIKERLPAVEVLAPGVRVM